jgi:hypothetical protein
MKKENPADNDMRDEYDFSSMGGGVRGKYAERLRQKSNIVILEPEIAEAFPTGGAVNAALRGMLDTARAVRTHGGLPNTALQPTGLGRGKSKPTRNPRAARRRTPNR